MTRSRALIGCGFLLLTCLALVDPAYNGLDLLVMFSAIWIAFDWVEFL